MLSRRPRLKKLFQGFLLFLDAEKAFDCIKWQYLHSVTEKVQLGVSFSIWLQILFKEDQSVVIEAEKIRLEKNDLKRGVRQGCPLSPLLFNLAIGLFATAVHINKDIKGFHFGKEEARLALYADDVVCILEHPLTSVKELSKII